MNENGINKFLELLNAIEENCALFKGFVISTEMMGELPLSEEQITLANVYLKKTQEEWSDSFIELLELCITWLQHNKKRDDD